MKLSQTEWQLIEDIFSRAVELPESQRQSFVAANCSDQPKVMNEVVTLLESHERTDKTDLAPLEAGVSDRVIAFTDKFFGDITQQGHPDDSEEDHQQIGQLLERLDPDLEVGSVIARGGTGVVFRAKQKNLGRAVAVKVLLQFGIDNSAKVRFIAESKATASIKHQNVVSIYSVQDGEVPFLIMEYLAGPSLDEALQKNERLSFRLSARIVGQIADGLQAAHEQNLVHRDVKPSNVMFATPTSLDDLSTQSSSKNVHVKLVDFGIVRVLDGERHTIDKMLIGTPAYMSPEQLFAPERVDQRSDVYALGVVLYEMLTGTRPFLGAPHMIMRQVDSTTPVPPRQLDDRIPRDLESICLKAMQRWANKRYPSALEFADDIKRFLNGEPTLARPVSHLERGVAWCRRNARLATALALSLLLMLSLVIGSLTFGIVVANKDREIQRQRLFSETSQLRRLLDAEPGAAPLAIEAMGELKSLSRKRLQETLGDDKQGVERKLNAAVALSRNGESQSELIVSFIGELHVSPSVCSLILFGIEDDPMAIRQLKDSLQRAKTPIEKAKRIILLAQLGDWDAWAEASSDWADPTLRTECIHQFPDWHGDLKKLATHLDRQAEKEWTWTVCQAILELDVRSVSQTNRERLRVSLERFKLARHYATYHFSQLAIMKLFGRENIPLQFKHPDCEVFGNGIRMIKVRAGKTRLGQFDPAQAALGHPPRSVEFTRDFYLSETEISARQYWAYLQEELGVEDFSHWKAENFFNETVSPTDDHPIQRVSFIDAAKYCNWLSRKHGLTPAYRQSDKALVERWQDGTEVEHFDWELIEKANGFRLPTDAQWEFTARNHSETRYFFGREERYFDQYGIGSSGRLISCLPVRHLRPNSRGFYGMLGNVWEWTDTRFEVESDRDLIDPRGPDEYSQNQFGRVHQGGGVASDRGGVSSESRGYGAAYSKYLNVGFRIALSNNFNDDFSDELDNSTPAPVNN